MLVTLFLWGLLSDLINRKKDITWTKEQAKFNLILIRYWEQAHEDAEARNGFLEEIRDAAHKISGGF